MVPALRSSALPARRSALAPPGAYAHPPAAQHRAMTDARRARTDRNSRRYQCRSRTGATRLQIAMQRERIKQRLQMICMARHRGVVARRRRSRRARMPRWFDFQSTIQKRPSCSTIRSMNPFTKPRERRGFERDVRITVPREHRRSADRSSAVDANRNDHSFRPACGIERAEGQARHEFGRRHVGDQPRHHRPANGRLSHDRPRLAARRSARSIARPVCGC